MPPKVSSRGFQPPLAVEAFLDTAGVVKRAIKFGPDAVVFAQGGQANSVF